MNTQIKDGQQSMEIISNCNECVDMYIVSQVGQQGAIVVSNSQEDDDSS